MSPDSRSPRLRRAPGSALPVPLPAGGTMPHERSRSADTAPTALPLLPDGPARHDGPERPFEDRSARTVRRNQDDGGNAGDNSEDEHPPAEDLRAPGALPQEPLGR